MRHPIHDPAGVISAGSAGNHPGRAAFRVTLLQSREVVGTPVLLDFLAQLSKELQQHNGFFVCKDFRGLLLSNWQRSETLLLKYQSNNGVN